MASHKEKETVDVDECGTGKAPHTFKSYYELNEKDEQTSSSLSYQRIYERKSRSMTLIHTPTVSERRKYCVDVQRASLTKK